MIPEFAPAIGLLARLRPAAAAARRAHLRRRPDRRRQRRDARGAARRPAARSRQAARRGRRRRDHAAHRARARRRDPGAAPLPDAASGITSSGSSPATASSSTARSTPAIARRFLAEHGDELALDLIDHKAADLAAKRVPAAELERARASCARLRDAGAVAAAPARRPRSRRRRSAAIGFPEGPELGRVLHELLDDVVDDPARNDRAWLLERAARELA